MCDPIEKSVFFLLTVNGNWGGWGGWGGCNRNCGGGTRTRSRACNNPAPRNGGRQCSGSSSSSSSCNTHHCPGKEIINIFIAIIVFDRHTHT